MKKEYAQLSKYYDVLHNKKNYEAEAKFFINLINKYKKSKGNRLLDVACGTGSHLFYFKKRFYGEGIDLNKNLIKIAKNKNPDLKFKIEDMRNFKINKKFDIITILFSSIAYLKNKNEINKTLKNVYNHLATGGILIIETLYLKKSFREIKNHLREYSDDSFSIKRVIDAKIKDNVAELQAKYFVKEKNKKETIIKDNLKIPLLTKNELIKSLSKIGFKIKIQQYNQTKTTIFICIKD